MYMVKYVIKRIALMFFVLFTIMTMSFVLIKMLPNIDAEQFGKDAALVAQRREIMGYNKPILVRRLGYELVLIPHAGCMDCVRI